MRIVRALFLLAVAVITTTIAPAPSCADSWAPPSTSVHISCGGRTRLTITPRDLESQLAYFEDKMAKVEPAGQRKGAAPFAYARLERRVGRSWRLIWSRRIVNEVAPVAGIVRDDGAYAIPFDNWGSTGYGRDVVAIYGSGGKLEHTLALSDIVLAAYMEALPHSVSSIRWRHDPRFSPEGKQIIIPVIVPSEEFTPEPATVELAIDLADGRVSAVDPKAWAAALATGRTVLTAQRAMEAAAKARFLAPLLGPRITDERAWGEYLNEAVHRLVGDDEAVSTTVLRMPNAGDYAVSRTWVREALIDSTYDKIALTSLSEPNLVSVLQGLRLTDRSLSKVTVFVAVSDRHWPGVVKAMRGSGARLVQIDPTVPIVQRPERIARRYGP